MPKDYAYGFRGPNDKIWGLREANQFSLELSIHTDYLLKKYGTKLDIIYEDGLQENKSYSYSKIIYWSELGLPQYPYPSPSTTPRQITTSTPLPTQTQPNDSPARIDTMMPLEDHSLLMATTVIVCATALALWVVLRRKSRNHKWQLF